MNKTLLILLSFSLIFTACKKSGDDSPESKTCQISTVDTQTLTYNNQGKISSIAVTLSPHITNINYETNKIKIISTNGEVNILLNLTDGKVTTAEDFNAKTTYTFTYDSEGYRKEAIMLKANSKTTVNYTYTDGNLTKLQMTDLLSNGSTIVGAPVIFQYLSEPASNIVDVGLAIETTFILHHYKLDSYFGKQSKNLISKVTKDGFTVNYTFTKDANGKITSVENPGRKYMVTYACK